MTAPTIVDELGIVQAFEMAGVIAEQVLAC